jgi:hypothetical protein
VPAWQHHGRLQQSVPGVARERAPIHAEELRCLGGGQELLLSSARSLGHLRTVCDEDGGDEAACRCGGGDRDGQDAVVETDVSDTGAKGDAEMEGDDVDGERRSRWDCAREVIDARPGSAPSAGRSRLPRTDQRGLIVPKSGYATSRGRRSRARIDHRAMISPRSASSNSRDDDVHLVAIIAVIG